MGPRFALQHDAKRHRYGYRIVFDTPRGARTVCPSTAIQWADPGVTRAEVERAMRAHARVVGGTVEAGRARSKPAGQARSRGGSGLAVERERRRVDARLQPRTPVTRQRFFFKALHRPAPARRRALDEESRRYYEERYANLEYGLEGVAHAIAVLRGEIDTDVYDRGNKVDYRHAAKGRKAFSPTGKRFHGRPAIAFDTAIRDARSRLRELNAEYRAGRHEQAEISDVLRYGEKPGHYRTRLAARRRGR